MNLDNGDGVEQIGGSGEYTKGVEDGSWYCFLKGVGDG